MSNLQFPQETEASALHDIETLVQKIFQYLNAVPLNTLSAHPLTSAELVGIMNGFTPFAAKFEELSRTAAALAAQGWPTVQSRLDLMIPDFLGMHAQYREMCNDRLQVERGLTQISAEANRVVQQNITAATKNMTWRFERQQKAIMDVMAGNCFYCHFYVGIPGGGYHLECAKKLLKTGVLP